MKRLKIGNISNNFTMIYMAIVSALLCSMSIYATINDKNWSFLIWPLAYPVFIYENGYKFLVKEANENKFAASIFVVFFFIPCLVSFGFVAYRIFLIIFDMARMG